MDIPTVTVYYFRKFDILSGEFRRSHRPATLAAIELARGEPDLANPIETTEAELDDNGFQHIDLK